MMTDFSQQFPVVFSALNEGFLQTLKLFAVTLLGALPLGMLIYFGEASTWAPLAALGRRLSTKGKFSAAAKLLEGLCPIAAIIKFIIWVVRGTPLMLQLIAVYFGPWYLFRIRISDGYRFYAVIIAFVLNCAAYFAEIYRAGIAAVPKGHREVAAVLGYTNAQAFFRIVLPQVIKHILPPMANEFITLIKDTSLAFAIGVMEMFTLVKQISSAQRSMAPLIAAAVFYYVFNAIVAFIMGRAEKRLDYYR